MKRREYVVIPVEIWEDENLSTMEMLLYAEIDSFSRYGECFASNEHFAKYLKISKDRVSKLLTSLRKKGYIDGELIYKKGTKEIEKRIIRPTSIHNLRYGRNQLEGIGESNSPSRRNQLHPPVENDSTPMGENAYDNNTLINKQVNNTSNTKNIKKKMDAAEFEERLESEFADFWNLYPRKKGGKEKAWKSFKKARKVKKVPYETIIIGLNKYIEYLNLNEKEEEFIAYGCTWLNQERWTDEYAYTTPQRKPKNATEYLKAKYGGENYESNRNRKIVEHYSEVIPELL